MLAPGGANLVLVVQAARHQERELPCPSYRPNRMRLDLIAKLMRFRRRSWVLALPFVVTAIVATPAQAFDPSAMSWSAPMSIDPSGGPPTAVSCASASLCVWVDRGGDIVSSTNPAGGAGAWGINRDFHGGIFSGVSCPTPALCVVTSSGGGVLTSSHPTATSGSWTGVVVPGESGGLNGISCPSASLCVGVGGNVVSSTNPAGGAGAWKAINVPGAGILNAVSCPSSSLCVAAGSNGVIATSTNPTGSASDWTVSDVDADNNKYGISCPSTSLCVAVGGYSHLSTSTNPTGGPSTWTTIQPAAPLYLTAISCSSALLCAGADEGGGAITSTHPTDGFSAWTPSNNLVTGGPPGLEGISCPAAAHICVAVGSHGEAVVGTDTGVRTVAVTQPASFRGTVTSSPAGIDCDATCSHSFPTGTVVTLHAVAKAGYAFAGWSGGGCSGTSDCTVTLDSDHDVTATFLRASGSYALGISKGGTGSGSVTSSPAGIDCGSACSASFAPGTQITLSANPNAGSRFTGWSGAGCSGTDSCQLTLDADTSVSAAFASTTHPPNTRIRRARIHQRTRSAVFTFAAAGASVSRAISFQCALSHGHKKARFRRCTSPKRYERLRKGHYTFRVRARDTVGKDPTPAKKTFRIK
jgi:hypothetical protein